MKKILAVLIAISMVATMAFAADAAFSVVVRASGNVVGVSDVTGEPDTTILNETQDSHAKASGSAAGWDVDVSMASSDDTAGASVALRSKSGESAAFANNGISLWIKPIADLKLTFFDAEVNLYNDWWYAFKVLNTTGDYGVTYTGVKGLTLDVAVAKDIKLSGLPTVGFKAAYAIDGVGTVAAVANLDKQYGVGITGISAGPVSISDVLFAYDDGTMTIYEGASADLGVISVTEYVNFKDLTGNLEIPAYVEVAGDVADVALACSAEWDSVLKPANVSITPSATISGNVGVAAWTLGAEVPVTLEDGSTKVDINLPYTVTVSF